jgi:hypothetical protein
MVWVCDVSVFVCGKGFLGHQLQLVDYLVT